MQRGRSREGAEREKEEEGLARYKLDEVHMRMGGVSVRLIFIVSRARDLIREL